MMIHDDTWCMTTDEPTNQPPTPPSHPQCVLPSCLTPGYGVRAPDSKCFVVAILIAVHSIKTVLINSIILGVVFARIAHPKNRGRTILISDSACIARRDGVLKL